jgi:hypothetical protein
MMILMTITALLSSAFFFVPKDQIWLMFALQIGMGLALGPKSPLASPCTPTPPTTTNGAPAAAPPP